MSDEAHFWVTFSITCAAMFAIAIPAGLLAEHIGGVGGVLIGALGVWLCVKTVIWLVYNDDKWVPKR